MNRAISIIQKSLFLGGVLVNTLLDTKGQTISLIKDILPGSSGSNPSYLTVIDNKMFFIASGAVWKTDGTIAGTELVKNISPNTGFNKPFTGFNNLAFFVANDGVSVSGTELWKSDGTTAGTVMVKDIWPGSASSFTYNTLFVFNDSTMFFTANDGVNGEELWKTDGTDAGTVLVKDIFPGSGGSQPGNFFNLNGTLFFTANDGVNGTEVWKSDGTDAGTVLVKDIKPGTASAFQFTAPNFITYNNLLYFAADDGANGTELWKSDGTAAGTNMVKDCRPGGGGSYPYKFAVYNGQLMFCGVNNDTVTSYPPEKRALWKSDGTDAGTDTIKSFYSASTYYTNIAQLELNGILYFVIEDFMSSYRELWRSDGTNAGTTMIHYGISYPYSPSLNVVTAINGSLYYIASDSSLYYTLWKSDGTTAGSYPLKDTNPFGPDFTPPLSVFYSAARNNDFYFLANNSNYGYEFWKSDGTTAGTAMITDLYPGTNSSFNISTGQNPYMTIVNDVLVFRANDGTTGIELYGINLPVSINEEDKSASTPASLYPNPFSDKFNLEYTLPSASHVRIEMYNMLGEKIKIWIDEQQSQGKHSYCFDAGNKNPGGVYLIRITTDERTAFSQQVIRTN